MIYLNEWEWVCQNNDRGTNYCIFRNAISEDVLYDFVIDKINGYREQKYLLDKSFDIYLKTYLDNNSVDNQLNKIEMELQEITSERKNRLKLNDKGILTDDELKDYLEKEYRPKEKELFNLKLKYTNINKEIEKAKRQYKNFIKQINEIDINNFTNADIKKVFSGIYVGTYRKFITESFLFTDESGEELNFENKDLATRPFTWVNESKMTFKHISCEFNFMNKNEMDIFEDMAEKDFMEHYDETISELDNIDESNIIDLDTFKESAQNNINDDSLLYISHRVIKKALKLMGE
jgi:hypothetical protein